MDDHTLKPLLVALDRHRERENGPDANLALHTDLSSQLLQDKLRDGESQPHAALVDVLGLGKLPKEAKELVKVLSLDA